MTRIDPWASGLEPSGVAPASHAVDDIAPEGGRTKPWDLQLPRLTPFECANAHRQNIFY
jgi:hypothetical protein